MLIRTSITIFARKWETGETKKKELTVKATKCFKNFNSYANFSLSKFQQTPENQERADEKGKGNTRFKMWFTLRGVVFAVPWSTSVTTTQWFRWESFRASFCENWKEMLLEISFHCSRWIFGTNFLWENLLNCFSFSVGLIEDQLTLKSKFDGERYNFCIHKELSLLSFQFVEMWNVFGSTLISVKNIIATLKTNTKLMFKSMFQFTFE